MQSATEQNTGRKLLATDFYVDVKDIGRFRLAKRTMRDEFQIGAEYSRLTEGVDTPTPWLAQMATMVANLKVLAVTVPEDWNIDEMDPLDDESYSRIFRVYEALRAREDSFRSGIGKSSEKTGQGVSEDVAVLVQEEIPTYTE
jgi:hypothetical protein